MLADRRLAPAGRRGNKCRARRSNPVGSYRRSGPAVDTGLDTRPTGSTNNLSFDATQTISEQREERRSISPQLASTLPLVTVRQESEHNVLYVLPKMVTRVDGKQDVVYRRQR